MICICCDTYFVKYLDVHNPGVVGDVPVKDLKGETSCGLLWYFE